MLIAAPYMSTFHIMAHQGGMSILLFNDVRSWKWQHFGRSVGSLAKVLFGFTFNVQVGSHIMVLRNKLCSSFSNVAQRCGLIELPTCN